MENLRIEPAREENLTEISVREEMIGKNDFVLKTLSTESIFDRRIVELGEIFSNRTIEAVSVIIENERKTFLFVKTANDEIERFLVEPDRNLTETRERISGSTDRWNSADNRLEFYRRFPDEESLDPDKFSERLSEIRSEKKLCFCFEKQFSSFSDRQKVSDSNFFEMMGQILRVKYHVDPSSLSCVLEVFFGEIFCEKDKKNDFAGFSFTTRFSACDGRRIFPNELKLLSNENQFFFYAILIDVKKRFSLRFSRKKCLFFRRKPKNKFFLSRQIFTFGTASRFSFCSAIIHNSMIIRKFRALNVNKLRPSRPNGKISKRKRNFHFSLEFRIAKETFFSR